MEELVSGGWINSSLADKEGFTLALPSCPPRFVPRRNPGAVYSGARDNARKYRKDKIPGQE